MGFCFLSLWLGLHLQLQNCLGWVAVVNLTNSVFSGMMIQQAQIVVSLSKQPLDSALCSSRPECCLLELFESSVFLVG